MKIAVIGLWHLGCVTAACLAKAGHDVIAYDDDTDILEKLRFGQAPLFEPGLDELLAAMLANNQLKIANSFPEAVAEAELIWITYDTPLLSNGDPEPGLLINKLKNFMKFFPLNVAVVISSQLPVGTVRSINPNFICIPENLQLGDGIARFENQEQIVIGLNDEKHKPLLTQLLSMYTKKITWVSLETAEMFKHALNSFLAVSVVFANEIARVCELVGADALALANALRMDPRVGTKAYVKPGNAFAGGTLGRDVKYLERIATEHEVSLPLIANILTSNELHARWSYDCLKRFIGNFSGKTIAILGQAYKPGTDSVRSSVAVALSEILINEGAFVKTYDPKVKALPAHLNQKITLVGSIEEALFQSDALVIATEWPEFKTISLAQLDNMRCKIVVDPNRFTASQLAASSTVLYCSVGGINAVN